LLQVAKDQGSEKAHTLLEGMRKVCDIEAERAKAPKIPSMEEIFKPEELARIKAIKEAQDALPVAKLTAPEHAAKVEEFYKKFASEVPGGAPAQEKVLHIVIGPPGAGKTSTLVDPLTREYRALVVDSDRIKPSINGYTADFQGKPEVGLGTNAVHHASSQVANDILQKAMQNGDNIVYPILGRVPESLIDITMRAKAQGYKVALHIADVPPEVAARRVFERAKGLPDENGVRQMVPPGYATSVAKYDPQIVFDKILKSMPDLFDAWRYANTNVPKGQPAIERRSTQQIPPPRR
jgi:predicted kinase